VNAPPLLNRKEAAWANRGAPRARELEPKSLPDGVLAKGV
jgi:hypothetical protein